MPLPCSSFAQHRSIAAPGRPRLVAARGSKKDAVAQLRPKYAKRSKQKGSLRLFLDSADVQQWERWQNGSLHGFTTNPAILERDNVPCNLPSIRGLVAMAQQLRARELQVQSWGGSAEALTANALRILELDPDLITIKLPCTHDGLTAASALLARDDDTSITITGVYTTHQVLLAQAVGADYAAPYLGRMADGDLNQLIASSQSFAFAHQQPAAAAVGGNGAAAAVPGGMEVAIDSILAMQSAVRASESCMRILVASIREASQMAILAANGCDTFTFSPAVMEQLVCVPATLQAAADFEAAAARNAGAAAAAAAVDA